jgi:hypothetical protein
MKVPPRVKIAVLFPLHSVTLVGVLSGKFIACKCECLIGMSLMDILVMAHGASSFNIVRIGNFASAKRRRISWLGYVACI